MIFLWKKYKFLQYVPESLIQAEAGNKPFRPLRPPIQGLSKMFEEWLLWKGSSQAGFEPLTETHLKQSIPAAEKKEINNSFLMSQDFLKKGEVFFCQPDITKQRDTSCCFLGPKKKVQKTSKHNYWFFSLSFVTRYSIVRRFPLFSSGSKQGQRCCPIFSLIKETFGKQEPLTESYLVKENHLEIRTLGQEKSVLTKVFLGRPTTV